MTTITTYAFPESLVVESEEESSYLQFSSGEWQIIIYTAKLPVKVQQALLEIKFHDIL